MCRGSGKVTGKSESAEIRTEGEAFLLTVGLCIGRLCVQPVETLLISR